MKAVIFLIPGLILLTFLGCRKDQQLHNIAVTFQPGSSSGKDAGIYSCYSCGYHNRNFGSVQELSAVAWTNNGDESDVRGLIEFDLSSIPAHSTITRAKLSLYFNPNSDIGKHTSLSGTNACLLQRITQSWGENSVTWDNQPATTEVNEVILPGSTSADQNYTDIDVMALVTDMINNPEQNFGFMLKLVMESYYNCLVFASSDYLDAALHPKLDITYLSSSDIH